MKANQAFRKNENAEVTIGSVITIMVLIVLVTSLVGLVASQIAAAQADSNISATNDVLLGLLLLAFILVPVIAIFSQVGKTNF